MTVIHSVNSNPLDLATTSSAESSCSFNLTRQLRED
jgi:hypothetical protein